MTRLESLREIYDAVKAGRLIPNDGTLQRLFPDAWPHVFEVMRGPEEIAAPGHALALIAATLPDYVAEMDTTGFARVWKDEFEATHTFSELIPGKPATALLLACVAALIAEEERK